jgi:SlyX protein
MNQDERITNLEIKLSFSEDLLEELNQTVFKQQQRIELLVKEIQTLKLQMASNIPSDGNSSQDERPPHY